MVSGIVHSIVQIPACNYTGKSDSTLYLLSTVWEDGEDHLLYCLTTLLHSKYTTENNQLVKGKQRCLHVFHCGSLKAKHEV